jgi:hypothetical protein
MPSKSISKSFSSIIVNSSLISENVKQNANVINRYGIDVPTFTADLDAKIAKANELNQHQERMKSELKNITLELNNVLADIEKQYALCKKTVKLAEPQAKWVGYGISDKK